jgi:hypothetical protein
VVRTRATDDDVLDIPERSAPHGRGRGQPSRGNALPPPPHMSIRLEQLLATQNELITLPSRAPFEALYGYSPRHFAVPHVTTSVTSLDQWLQDRKVQSDLIKQHFPLATLHMEQQADKGRTEPIQCG